MPVDQAASQRQMTAEQALSVAMQHHGNGRLAEAETIYQRVLEAQPENPVVLHLLGVVAHQMDNNESAVDLITKALAIKPDYAEAHSNIGLALQELGQPKEAEASYRTALAINPDYDKAQYNRGNVLGDLNRLDEAVASYRKALSINPDYVEAHHNLGYTLNKQGKHHEAVASYHKALAINPDYVEAYCNLGVAFQGLGRLDEAVACQRKALAIDPDYTLAHYSLGVVLKVLGQFEDAVRSFDLSGLSSVLGETLECLYTIEKYEEFYLRLNRWIETNKTDIRVAAISAFASHQLVRENPFPFCKAPLDFIRVSYIGNNSDDTNGLIDELVEDLNCRDTLWEPTGSTTTCGFQTMDNLFADPEGSLAKLDQIIKAEINSYRSEFMSADCLFMELWPKDFRLNGWFVRLVKHGYQDTHIHPGGWLSGVVYLKLSKKSKRDEGAIEFSLHGNDYPILNDEYPRTLHRPKKGQIVLFPSSLFHKTLPINTGDERLSIAFDLIPT